MPDRVHFHPNLIFSVGTKVVTQIDVLDAGGNLQHPKGSVGVVVKAPTDLQHSYRVRFSDGIDVPLKRDQVTLLAQVKEGEIGDSDQTVSKHNLFDRVIYTMVTVRRSRTTRKRRDSRGILGDPKVVLLVASICLVDLCRIPPRQVRKLLNRRHNEKGRLLAGDCWYT